MYLMNEWAKCLKKRLKRISTSKSFPKQETLFSEGSSIYLSHDCQRPLFHIMNSGGRSKPKSTPDNLRGLMYCHVYWGHEMHVCGMNNTLHQEPRQPGRRRSDNKTCYFHLYRLPLQRGDSGHGSEGQYNPTTDKSDSSPTEVASPGLIIILILRY